MSTRRPSSSGEDDREGTTPADTPPVSSLLAVVEPAAHPGRVIHRIVTMARERLGLEVSFLSEFAEGQRMIRYVDGDAVSFDVKVDSGDPLEDTYCQRIVTGVLSCVIPDTSADPVTRALAVTEGKALGAYVGVPVVLSDGQVYGTFCVASHTPQPQLNERDVEFLRVAAALAAEQLDREVQLDVPRRHARDQTRQAIRGEGSSLVFQPVMELDTGRICAVEALSRFDQEPPRPPDIWFSQGWEVGMGLDLELAAVQRAIAVLDRLPAGITLTVNVSADAVLSLELLDLLAQVPGERIVLEITEHDPIHDYAALRSRLREVRQRGIRLALDDMGTGYSGLTALVELRPEVHKIDRSIVRGMRHDRSRRALVAGWVAYAATMGAIVIAEGIETGDELEALQILGVRYGQGFHLAAPAPLDALDANAVAEAPL